MTTTRRSVLAGGSLLTSLGLLRDIPTAAAQPVDAGGAPQPAASPPENAIEAYIYGYPLVTMEMTRRVMTNAAKPEGLRGPMGQFANAREYPTAAFKDVTAPNADTLYSSAWLDLSKEPYILQLPDEHGRYYLMPMLDAWTECLCRSGHAHHRHRRRRICHRRPGLARRTACRASRSFARPRTWSGSSAAPTAPARRRTTRPCTRSRTVQARAAQRLRQALHAAARQGRSQHRHEDAGARAGQPDGRDQLLQAAGRADEGQPARCGRTRRSSRGWRRSASSPGRTSIRQSSPPCPTSRTCRSSASSGSHATFPRRWASIVNGWMFFKPAGRLRHRLPPARVGHADRPRRNSTAGRGLSDHRRWTRRADAERGQQIRHALPKGPDAAGARLLVADDVRRAILLRRQSAEPLHAQCAQHAQVQSRRLDRPLHPGENPGPDKEANWLPAPNGPFVLMMRLYWPKENPPSILDGTWKPPPVNLST